MAYLLQILVDNNDVNGRPTTDSGCGGGNVNGRPTSNTGFGEGNVNCRPTSNTGFGDGSVNTTQYFNISGGVNTSAATTDYASRAERHELATQAETNARLNKDKSRWLRVLDKRLSQL